MPQLVAKGVTKRFGGLVAVRDLDLEIEPRSIVSVIGPNGAGKTTLFNCIAGWYRIDEGEIQFEGQAIDKLRRDQISRLGIARTYQNIRLFDGMSAVENVLVGQHHFLRAGWFAVGPAHAGRARRGGEGPRGGPSPPAFRRHPRSREEPGERAAIRRPAAAGDRPRLEHQAAPAPARRADRRDEPRRDPQDDRIHPSTARRAGDHDPPDRARDAGGDGHLRADHRARLRREDRRGHAARDPDQPARHRGLPGTRSSAGHRDVAGAGASEAAGSEA